jgi:LysR family transcriptional regulator for metE and metH
MLLVSNSHWLASASWIKPEQLTQECLISFPVAAERLDMLTHFLWPAGVRTIKHKQLESFEIMLQMVAYNRGICALPDWLAAKVCGELPLKALRLGRRGINRKLHVAYRQEDRGIGYLQRFLQRAKRSNPAK